MIQNGRLLAVRRVTENRGKKTPGVDGVVWDTPEKKWKAVERLGQARYRAAPLRRLYNPKANGKKRPLGIPTMFDRGQQALHKLGLEPVAECLADANSYGFRPERSARDAAEQVFNALRLKTSAQWVLEGDIKACFDEISHDWLLANVSMDKRTLAKWLKSGYMDKQVFHHHRRFQGVVGRGGETACHRIPGRMVTVLYVTSHSGETRVFMSTTS